MLHFLRLYRLWFIFAAAVIGLLVGFTIVAGLRSTDPVPTILAQNGLSKASSPLVNPGLVQPTRSVPAATVPNLTGERVAAAEERLRAAGYLGWQTVDATGQGRTVLEPNNWIVVQQNPPAGGVSPLDTVVIVMVKKPTDDYVPVRTAAGVVPNVVCAELQDAQDALRAARFFLLTSTDATGQSRVALVDRDWIVIAQSVRPGTSPGLTTHIELTIVKYGEPSGGSGCPT